MDRGKKITKEAGRQILRDIERYPGLSSTKLLARRPKYYLGKYRKSARNRYDFLIRQKKTQPELYYAKKREIGPDCELSESEVEEDQSPDDEKEDRSADEKEGFTTPKKGRREETTSSSTGTRRSTGTKKARFAPTGSANKKTSTPCSAPSPQSEDMETPSGKSRFTSLQHAVDKVDEVIELDDFLRDEQQRKPEGNTQNLFIQRINKIKSRDGKELIQKLKITVTNSIDIRDLKQYNCLIVLKGSALLLEVPRIPMFLMENHIHFLSLEKERCEQTELETAASFTAISEDPKRLHKKILIAFPEDSDVALTADFTKNIPTEDTKVKRQLRTLEVESLVGKRKDRRLTQHFFTIHWEMRVLTGAGVNKLRKDEDSDSDLEDAIRGCRVSTPTGGAVPEPRPRNPTGQVPQPIPDPAQSQSHDELFGGVDGLRDSNPTGPAPSTLAVCTEPLPVNDDTESQKTKARGFKDRANPREHRRIRQEKQSELRKQARERILSELRGMPIGAGAVDKEEEQDKKGQDSHMPEHEELFGGMPTIDGWSEEEDDNLSDSEISAESDGEQFQMNLGNNINDMIETLNEGQQILEDNGDY